MIQLEKLGRTEVPSVKDSLSQAFVSLQGGFLFIKLIFRLLLPCQTSLLLERKLTPAGAVAQREG